MSFIRDWSSLDHLFVPTWTQPSRNLLKMNSTPGRRSELVGRCLVVMTDSILHSRGHLLNVYPESISSRLDPPRNRIALGHCKVCQGGWLGIERGSTHLMGEESQICLFGGCLLIT